MRLMLKRGVVRRRRTAQAAGMVGFPKQSGTYTAACWLEEDYSMDSMDSIIWPGRLRLLEFEIETVHTGRLIEIFWKKN